MKSIKTYEGFFDFFRKQSEDDKIVELKQMYETY